MDVRVQTSCLPTPCELLEEFSLNELDKSFILQSRKLISDCIHGNKKQLLCIVGPCSIHNYDEAIEYAEKLSKLRDSLDKFFIVLRLYFEKPRTRGGWKGFIYDPYLNETNNISTGLRKARQLMVEITKRFRLPIATEFLDTITPQYFSDIVSYGAIGARTVESQVHRQLASGLSMPVGLKNRTDGDIMTAINSLISVRSPHSFLGIDIEGKASRIDTVGNPDTHIILRGGYKPNYDFNTISEITKITEEEGISTSFLIDLSHGNSCKNFKRQVLSAFYIWRLYNFTKLPIVGIMIESNLEEGSQSLQPNLLKGVSITDPCLGFSDTKTLLTILNTSKLVKEKLTLQQYRDFITNYETLYNTPVFCQSDLFTLFDDELLSCTTNMYQLVTYGLRSSILDSIAECKFYENPFKYLQSRHDILTQLQDIQRERELTIDSRLLDISKRLQTQNILSLCKKTRIGYLYGLGTISHEAITENFRGHHVAFKNIVELNSALIFGEIEYALIPIYNNIIGNIFPLNNSKSIGTIDKQVQLTLYANTQYKSDISMLFLESHIQKESESFLSRYFPHIKIASVMSTRDGIGAVLASRISCGTIASSRATHSLLHRLDDNITPMNFTTFALVRKI